MTRRILLICSLLVLALLSRQAIAQLTIDTTTATDWKISNGSLSLDWNSTTGSVFGIFLTGFGDNLVDTTDVGGNGQPKGLYMDNSGTLATGTVTANYHLSSGHYLDWWITTASNSTNAFTTTQHFILTPNDPTLHVYFTANHSATDIAGDLGQVQYVFRISQSLFTNTYSVNSGLNNLGATAITLPTPTVLNTTDPGRQVENAVVDLHGLSLPSGFGREFYTKYDYSSYEYLHQAHGLYGTKYGAWTILPSTESLVAGPTKQDLIFTGNILMMEMLSGHLDNELSYVPPQGVNTTRLFGPFAFHFNVLGGGTTTPASLYQDALNEIPTALTLYSNEGELDGNGYVLSTNRGTVAPTISGAGSSTANTAWAVLSDNEKGFQASANGRQYWASENSAGTTELTGVVPGTYRLSAYVLGKWGELRDDNIAVTANTTTTLHSLTFTPENFGTATPIWTIGTPDRSAHEFRHGKNSSGQDDREFYGNWNYWQDFAANSGAVVYYATAVGSHAATNNLNDWNYVQWQKFDPGLYAGIYNSSDDTTDGYTYIVPAYVGNPSTAVVPPWQVHFTTTSSQLGQGQYAVLSVALAAAQSNLTVSLNGHALAWTCPSSKISDPAPRSGFTGTYQWVVYQFATTDLNPAGQDNVLTFTVDGSNGVMYDALRMEITGTSADPAVKGWHDYEYLFNTTYTPANDAVSSND